MRKAYNKYQSTNEKWMKTIPSHWSLKRLKGIFYLRKESNNPIVTREILSLTAKQGVIPYKDKIGVGGNKPKSDLTKYNICRVGDLLVNNMNVVSGAAGVSKYMGCVSPVYYPLVLRNNSNCWYYHYIFRLLTFQRSLIGLGKGILMHENDKGTLTSVRMRISMDYLGNVQLPVPPREEQEQIVRFLDWKISSINKLINLKQQEITELKELKKATISDAVTHGLDKTVPMKDSGISWLGKIPQHWEILSLKHVSRINASIANEIAKLKDLDLVTFLPMENISETGNIDCSIKRPLKEVRSGFSSFSKSDVAIAKITPCFENGKGACLDELDTTIGFGTTELINLRANSRILPKFLYLITVLQEFRKLGERAMTGSAGQKRVPLTYIKNFTIGIPPIEEQKHILLEVDKRSKSIDKCILSKHEELKTLHDLKSSLIADVVTGKIDVRDVEIPDYEQVEETLYKSNDNDTLQSEDEIPEEV